MKRFVVATLSAAVIATLAVSSSAEAAMIDFSVIGIDGTPTYDGTSLDQSIALDFDNSLLLVSEVGPADASGLTPGADTVNVSPTDIAYGAGTGPSTLPGAVILSWTGDGGDTFTETLTMVDVINRTTPDQIIFQLSGTVSDTDDLFVDTPALFVVNATQFNGPATTVTFTNATGVAPSVPEPSTWVMLALGFGALGYAGIRQSKANRAAFSS
jgi:hypothetical protein